MKKIIFTGGNGKFGRIFKNLILIEQTFIIHLLVFLMLQFE